MNRSSFQWRRCTALVIAILFMFHGHAMARTFMSYEPIYFYTMDQPLSASSGSVPLTYDLYNESHQRSFGEIREVTLETVSLEELQAAWEEAVATCDAKSYGSISPTRTECIEGVTLTYPSGTKYCSLPLGGSVPCGIKYTTVTIKGIGPKPTAAITGTFDVGATVEMTSSTRIGADIVVAFDPGEVDVTYAGYGWTTISEETASPGVYVVEAGGLMDEAATSIVSEYNETASTNLVFEISSITEVELKTCQPPEPCTTQSVTAGLAEDGSAELFREEFLNLDFDPSATGIVGAIPYIKVAVLNQPLFEFGPEHLIDAGLAPEVFEYEITVPLPGGPPVKGLPEKAGVGLPIGDVGLYATDYDLTTDFSCDGDGCVDSAGIGDDGRYHRTREPDWLLRTGLGLPGEVASIVLPTDHFRADVDLDFLLITGKGLGVQVELPILASVLVDAIDYDLSTFWGKNQDLAFSADVQVTYLFSAPTQVEIGGQFESVSAHTIYLGETFKIKDPAADLVITPIYNVTENAFSNLTHQYVDFAIEEKVLAAQLGGLLFEALGIDKQYAALTASIGFGDVKTKTLIDDTYPLSGFADYTGEQIRFSVMGSPGGNGNNTAELVTGSSVDLSQSVNTSALAFNLTFDYLFLTTTGQLDVYLGTTLLGTLMAPVSAGNSFGTHALTVSDPSLLSSLLDLRFSFDGPTGSRLLLDNIAFSSSPGAVLNGDFETADLANWTVATQTVDGSAGVVQFEQPATGPGGSGAQGGGGGGCFIDVSSGRW